jgi:hypothetical protein
MIQRHRPAFTDDILESYRLDTIAASGDHNAENAAINQVGTGGTQPCGQQAVSRRRRPAALQVPQNRKT